MLINRNPSFPRNARVVVNIVLGLIVVGIALWLINTYVPMASSIKAILNIVVVVATCVVILQQVGLWGSIVRLWDNFTHHELHQ
jgi:predicted membrane protein